MEYIIAILLFAPIIFKCLKEKKWYLFLFFSFYGILPDTFAIEISQSLPLITVKRLLILLLLVFWMVKKRGIVSTKYIRAFCIYTAIEVFISIFDFRFGFGEINRLFIIVFERLLPVITIRDLVADDKEFEKCLDYIVFSSISVSIIGILQTVAHIDVSDVFQIIEGRTATSLSERMGLMRAKGLVNAIQFGSYCDFVILLALYKYLRTKKRFYVFSIGINFVALFLSMSRSSLVPVLLIVLFLVFKESKKFIKPILKYLPVVGVAIIFVFLCFPNAKVVFDNIMNSILQTLGIAADVSSDFGDNVNASASRLMQFSLIPYMFAHGGWLFGLGYNAFINKMLYFYYPMYGGWSIATTMDVGFVSKFGSSGLVGVMAIGWYMYVLFAQCKRCYMRKEFDYYKLLMFEIGLFILLNILTACMAINVFWMMIMLFYAKQKIDQKKRVKYV